MTTDPEEPQEEEASETTEERSAREREEHRRRPAPRLASTRTFDDYLEWLKQQQALEAEAASTAGMSARERAAATKRRRTREKLIQAVDRLMQGGARDVTVDEIAKDAGVSVPTFYTYYKSRNALCVDALTTTVVTSLEEADTADQSMADSFDALQDKCSGRTSLLRAALIGRLEAGPIELTGPQLWVHDTPLSVFLDRHLRIDEKADFVMRTARLLADEDLISDSEPARLELVLPMAALRLLDSWAMQSIDDPPISGPDFENAVRAACRGKPQPKRYDSRH